MLLQITPTSSLSPAELQRLLAAAPSLLWTNEASQTGVITFEGRNFRIADVRSASARPVTPQNLFEVTPQSGIVL